MTDQAERYDRIAEGYERWWAPVLAPSALALLDRVETLPGAPTNRASPGAASGGDARARDILDVGVGTGNLALPALERWPSVRLTGIDVSSEMVRAVDGLADARLRPADRARFTTRVAPAADLPFADASFDLAITSFVLQLVPNRAAALREIRRVLRPGGRLAYVTWLRDARAFAPDRVFDALLEEYGFETGPDDGRCGDVPSVSTAAGELRRAGYRAVTAEDAMLEHDFGVDGYIAFLTEFDEASLFEEMTRTERRRFLATLRERLMALGRDAMTFRVPIVYASGIRSDG